MLMLVLATLVGIVTAVVVYTFEVEYGPTKWPPAATASRFGGADVRGIGPAG
jgi:hypothetical protein